METRNSVYRILWGLKSRQKDWSIRTEVLVLNDRDRFKRHNEIIPFVPKTDSGGEQRMLEGKEEWVIWPEAFSVQRVLHDSWWQVPRLAKQRSYSNSIGSLFVMEALKSLCLRMGTSILTDVSWGLQAADLTLKGWTLSWLLPISTVLIWTLLWDPKWYFLQYTNE